MGSPRQLRKKYETPSHPWQKERIDFEKKLTNEYGLRRKNELWKMGQLIKKLTNQVKKLTYDFSEQGQKEKEQLMKKVVRLGLLDDKAVMPEVLVLTVKDILERRLQTIVFKKSLASSVKHARQLIVHGHIFVNTKKVTSPSYVVLNGEESSIIYNPNSALNNADHPSNPANAISKEKITIKEGDKKEIVEVKEKTKEENVVKEDKKVEEKKEVEKPKEKEIKEPKKEEKKE